MFLQTDPVPGGSANNYDYVNQNPVNNYDLNGRAYVNDPGGAGGGFDPRYCSRQGDWCPGTANYRAERRPPGGDFPMICFIGGGVYAAKQKLTKTATVYIGGKVLSKLIGKIWLPITVAQAGYCFATHK